MIPLRAADPLKVPLWPEGAPGATGQEPADQPWVDVYRPDDKAPANGCAVVVCPGGGYGGLADDHEGIQPARFYNSFGVTAYVLHYRLGSRGYRHPIELGDAQRALRLVRSRAGVDGIDPSRLGIMGFSAGGHLAATAGTHYNAGNPAAPDPVDRQGCRPDFQVLCYGVLSFDPAITHKGSVQNLLGDQKDDPALIALLSNELQVTDTTPPAFLFHTAEDKAVPVANSLRFFEALQKHRVPSELHVYQDGPHGVGLAPGNPVTGTWPDLLKAWMRQNQWLGRAPRTAFSGRLTFHGKPVPRGTVTLAPLDGNHPVTSLTVRDGAFKTEAGDGPVALPSAVTVTYSDESDASLSTATGFTTTGSLDRAAPLPLTCQPSGRTPVVWDIRN
ncbi:MAG: alpha/beta hydrolase [Verrucomicrobiaceae bacterium]|nr:MAG: alpha/beta hydrolase [Verrucomicrobiaceae bacterium]